MKTLRSLVLAAVTAVAVTPLGAETVRLEGGIDAARLHEIAMSDRAIETLDLSGADIEAYNGPRLAANRTCHPAGVLPAYALSGLKARRVILPQTLTAIGDGALTGSTIEEIVIPASVTSIGRGAFAACTRLKTIAIPATVTEAGTHLLTSCTALTRARVMSGAVPASAFAGCTALAEVTLGGNTAAIGDDAFAGCTSLRQLDIPASVRRIGDRAFARSGVERVELAHCTALAEVGVEAFAHCPELTAAALPASLARMGRGVFFDSHSLGAVTLPSALKTLPALTLKGVEGVYDASALLPEGLDSIGTLAMAGMNGASTVTIPGSVRHIGDGAFEGWESMSMTDASALREVPSLGADVWSGVEQGKVYLDVDPSMTDLFMAAPQWREFSFDKSGTTQTVNPKTHPDIRVRFDGDMLHVRASGVIAAATLHDLAGMEVARAGGEGAEEVTLDTSGAVNPFFILSVTLADGCRGTIKLIRQ